MASQLKNKHERKANKHARASTKTKTVKIKHHHAKPYRKRHVASLVILTAGCLLLIGLLVRYNNAVAKGVDSARTFLVATFNPQSSTLANVESSFGFGVTYDSQKFYATAVDRDTGELVLGNELAIKRAYDTLRIAPSLQDTNQASSSLTMRYHDDKNLKGNEDLATIEGMVIGKIIDKANLPLKKESSTTVKYGDKEFIKTTWYFEPNNKILSDVRPTLTTLTTNLNNHPFTVEVNTLVSDSEFSVYDNVLRSLHFGDSTAFFNSAPSPEYQAQLDRSRNLLETALFGQLVSAQSNQRGLSSEQISSRYGPAVIKIFNVYCQDIYFDGQKAISNLCDGGTGSGFFINQDGHIASNGHVTNSDPKDLLIAASFTLLQRGQTGLFDALADVANISASEVPKTSTKDTVDYVYNRFYEIDGSRVSTKNSVTNLLVVLGKDQPDVKELVAATTKRQEYAEQNNIKRGEVVAQNYRTIDGIAKFYGSDVSIVKIEGSNYPVVKTGNVATLMQGADLSILGYPGNASDNGIVDGGESEATLTSGKVSSVKNALGSDKKLIETDTTIGHGNSGGPAFANNGEVVGIATYTAAKSGDGTYNYIRDIQDLISLADESSIQVNPNSKTQQAWEKGLDLFGRARYSKSLASFEEVKSLYPEHPRVEEFIAAANENIKSGKDVKDFPVTLVAVGVGVLLVAAAVVVVIIVRHKRAHNVYKAHVSSGAMQPVTPGSPAQTVSYSPAQVAAQNNVFTQTPPAAPTQPVTPQAPAPNATVTPQQQQVVSPNQPKQPPL